MLLKDELMEATGLNEESLKEKLIASATSEFDKRQADEAVEGNEVRANSWAYITMLYSSMCNPKDEMLKAIK